MARTTHWTIAVLLMALTLTLVNRPPQADAASTSNLYVLKIDDDTFSNYDLNSPSYSGNNVDWPVNLLFRDNAEIDKVKNAFNARFPFLSFSPQYLYISGDGVTEYDADGGRKELPCPQAGQEAIHFRLYADSADDRLFNLTLGFFVLGTSHFDIEECDPIDMRFGDSERAEIQIAGYATSIYGINSVFYSNTYLWNIEPLRIEGNHIWNSDGHATLVYVP